MSNLLSIEASFLSNPQVKAGMNLQQVTALQRTMAKAEKKTFENTLSMAKLSAQAWAWVNSAEGKALCEEEGVTFTKEALGEKVFGYKKSFFCKLVKAGELPAEVIEGANIAVRIDTDGAIHTTADKDAVLEAIRLFTTKVKYAVNQ